MRTLITTLALSLLYLSPAIAIEDPILLTGYVKARNNQAFFAPKTDNWRVQIKWMAPEGQVVKAGELAVLFDSGSIESIIEQEEINLLAAEDELYLLIKTGGQNVLKAEYEVNRAELQLQKARIEANISRHYIIEFEYQQFQMALEKALVALVKAKGAYQQAKLNDSVARTKQQLTINRLKDNLAYQQHLLSKMAIYAEKSGPILYKDYWNGEKIYVGMTVNVATQVAQIPTLSELYIEAWIHEIDYQKIALDRNAKLSFDAFPNQQFAAQLKNLSTQPEEKITWGNDVYFKAEFSFNAPQNIKLLPGMSALLEVDNPPINKINNLNVGVNSD